MKYAIALMSELFTAQEMGRSCYVGTKTKKPCLPLKKRELLEGSLSLFLLSQFKTGHYYFEISVLVPRMHRQEVWCRDGGCLLGCPKAKVQPKMLQHCQQAEKTREIARV